VLIMRIAFDIVIVPVPCSVVASACMVSSEPENVHAALFVITPIAVGDATTEKLQSYGIIPSLQIVDAQEKRIKREPPQANKVSTNLSCQNPAGEITEQSIEIIKQAITSKPPVRIIVDGEEDLLVIPVCIYAPENTIIMYGQPNEGLVVVTVNEEIKKKTKSILDAMN